MSVHRQTAMLYVPLVVLLSGGKLGQSFTSPLWHPHTQTPNYGCLATKYTNTIWVIFIDDGMTTYMTICNSMWTEGRLILFHGKTRRKVKPLQCNLEFSSPSVPVMRSNQATALSALCVGRLWMCGKIYEVYRGKIIFTAKILSVQLCSHGIISRWSAQNMILPIFMFISQ